MRVYFFLMRNTADVEECRFDTGSRILPPATTAALWPFAKPALVGNLKSN